MQEKNLISLTSFEEISSWYDQASSQLGFPEMPNELYEPVRHIMNMKGKRIRPVLLLMGCDAYNGNLEMALSPAYGIEVFHNFTLVHDDIMDKAEKRRGLPTVHQKYGINKAILSGDVMMMYAYRFLSHVPDEKLREVLTIFNKTATEVMEGQQMDMNFETRSDVTIDEYLKMIEYKTSVLLAASLQIGAVLANASEKDQNLMYKFGLKLGLAFQIKDDYLDAYGDERVGKVKGGDILQNKKTYLAITARNQASEEKIAILDKLLIETDPDKKVSQTLEIFNALDIPGKTHQFMESLYREALEALHKTSLNAEKRAGLEQMAELIYNREY